MKKLISWNVNGLRACVQKGFTEYFKEVDADIFCIQEKDRLILHRKDIMHTGIMQKRRATLEPPFLQKKSHYPQLMESESKNTIMRGASSLWNLIISTW